MKIVVIGGSGLVGGKVVERLRTRGHEALAASPSSGVNVLTGEGLDAALVGAQAVIDVVNAPSFEDAVAMNFFETAGRTVLAAEARAGVQHHVALSIVGTERMQASGYFRAKLAQETLIQRAQVPYTIVRATQFFEFIGAVAQAGTQTDDPDRRIHLPAAAAQPLAADDVADALTDIVLAEPVNGIVEIAGPDRLSWAHVVRQWLDSRQDLREVVADPAATYFGVNIDDRSLTPDAGARLGTRHLSDWLRSSAQ